MKNKTEIVEQTKLAFDFIQKLYLETSYLVKEIEGIFNEENEKFIIGRPAGYGITSKSSTGLESNSVPSWLLRKFAVFFIEEDITEFKGGITNTKLDPSLKVIYLRLLLDDPQVKEPTIYSAVLYRIEKNPENKRLTKFEYVMTLLEYKDNKVFINPSKIDYEDSYLSIKGKFIAKNLYDINDSEDIRKLIIEPSLKIYRSIVL
jgi:hypothetical protein